MFAEIWFNTDEPPTGVIRVEGDPPVHFSGWLGLLQTMQQALRDQPSGEISFSVAQ